MKSSKKNKLNLTQNEFGILCLLKEGLLGLVSHLMNEEESEKVIKTGKFNGEIFPYPISFAPSDKKNLQNIESDDEIELFFNEKSVGMLQVKEKFKQNLNQNGILNTNSCFMKERQLCLSGEFNLSFNPLSSYKQGFNELKERTKARKITALVSSFDPLHRAHERMFRWTIDKADFVVIFLIESYVSNGFEFELKERYLREFAKQYLPPDKIFIFPLKGIDLFHAHLNPGLECILAKSLGCTKLVVGQNHSGLGMYYDDNQPHSVLDEFSRDYGIEVVVLPEFVFCDKCRMIVSTKSCPHGTHHHLHYDSNSLKSLLRAGLIPPAIFVRKEISSIILSHLFKNRFKNMQQIYYSLFPTNGILEYKTDEDFYKKILELHQMSYMV